MVQWPPSPTVEDEQSSLAKEHCLDPSSRISKTTDEQSVPSRGSVDQFPIILGSDTEDVPQKAEPTYTPASAPSTPPRASKNLKVTIPGLEDFGYPTPPPSDNGARGRHRLDEFRNTRTDIQREARSRSCDPMYGDDRSRTRPAISRNQTEIPDELNSVKAGTLRASSPHTRGPETTGMQMDSVSSTTVQYLSPAYATNSPLSILAPASQSEAISRRKDRDSSTDSVRRPKKVTRFSDAPRGPGSSYGTPREPSVSPNRLPESPNVQSERRLEQLHAESRAGRPMDRVTSGYGSQEVARLDRSSSRPSRSASKAREPQYVTLSSLEEKLRGGSRRASVERGISSAPATRPVEKLRPIDFSDQNVTHHKANPRQDDADKHTYYVRGDQYSMTPPSVTTPKHMEDYFSQAFERNSQKTTKYTPRLSFDGSTPLSPPSSPPRTPKGERQSRIYVVSPPSSPRRLSRQPRLPSWDESQYIELKAPTTLLSQATVAATIAAKTSPTESRSYPTTIDAKSNVSGRGSIPKSRSRPPSPIRESRSSSARRYPSLPPCNRSSMRDDLSRTEVLPPITFQSARPTTLNSVDANTRLKELPSNGLHHKNTMPAPLPSPLRTSAPIYGPQSTFPPTSVNAVPTRFVLPKCPRSRPLPGLQDWKTIRGIPGIRICPTCTKAINETKYHKLLDKSPSDRDEQSIDCGMSKSWIRVAFMQSLNQNRPDLKFVDEVVRIPSKYHPCPGHNKEYRRWYSVKDLAYGTFIPNFSVCSACVRTIDKIFPNIPNHFERTDKVTERSCNFHTDSRDFLTLIEQLDLLAWTCRERGISGTDRANPFVCSVYHIAQRPECAREAFLSNHTWHFMDDLPEFTICAACFDEIISPLGNKPIVKHISRVSRSVPPISTPGSPLTRDGSHPVSCQLYSDKMRRYLLDAVHGMISYDKFKAKAKERFMTQWRLEENQRTLESLKAEVDRKARHWRSME